MTNAPWLPCESCDVQTTWATRFLPSVSSWCRRKVPPVFRQKTLCLRHSVLLLLGFGSGRQNQTQGVEARYAVSTTFSGGILEGPFACTTMTQTVRSASPMWSGRRNFRMAAMEHWSCQLFGCFSPDFVDSNQLAHQLSISGTKLVSESNSCGLRSEGLLAG